jgi:hypothetical protein
MKKKKRYTTEKTWETTCQRARSRTGPGRGEEGQTRLKLIVGFHMGIRNVVKVMGSSHVGDDDGYAPAEADSMSSAPAFRRG